jgi:hypothetical protein
VPAPFSPDGPRQWTCDFCAAAPPSCWWQPGTVSPALPKAFAVPGLVADSSAETPWMACPGCSPLVAAGDLAGLLRRWRDLAPVPPGADPRAHRRANAPAVTAMLRHLLDSGPSGPHPLP